MMIPAFRARFIASNRDWEKEAPPKLALIRLAPWVIA